MTLPSLYPLKFKPQLIEKVWGGERLFSDYGKKARGFIGESWEISGVPGHISQVSNGTLAGRPLTYLIASYGEELLGKQVVERYGIAFPLLIKLIDAREDLSVQLHPNDEIAKERHNSFGKTEMWYILDAEKDARLILGFDRTLNKESYQEYLSEGKIMDVLGAETVERGDAFYIAPGTVHAIGAGILLAEIQQTSDITYRIYDWDRPGLDGKMRELHNDQALDVIDFNPSRAKLQYTREENKSTLVCESPYFKTNVLTLSRSLQKELSQIDSFVVYMCIEGEVTIGMKTYSEKIQKGETILIPASANEVEFETKGATLLEVYVPSEL